jgi:hypothetical protein
MRDACRAGRRIAVLVAAGIMAVTGLLTACGTAGSGSNGTGPPGGAAPLTQVRTSGSHSGSRAEALGLARQLLSRLVLPPGVGPVRVSPLPRLLRHPVSHIAAAGSVDAHRLFTLPQPMPISYRFLLAHVPAGMRLYANGQGSGPAGVSMQDVSYAPRSVPAGIYQAQLATVVVPGRGGTALLRADAQVIWFPPRTPAEHLDPADFRKVTISARVFNPRPHTVTRVVTSPAVILRLASLLNGLPAAPDLSMSCAAAAATYRVAFAAGAVTAPAAIVTADGCLTDQITVSGKAQPVLWDRSEKLVAAVSQLLRVKPQL